MGKLSTEVAIASYTTMSWFKRQRSPISSTNEFLLTILDEMSDADKRMDLPHFGSDRQTSGSGLIREFRFKSRITFG